MYSIRAVLIAICSISSCQAKSAFGQLAPNPGLLDHQWEVVLQLLTDDRHGCFRADFALKSPNRSSSMTSGSAGLGMIHYLETASLAESAGVCCRSVGRVG